MSIFIRREYHTKELRAENQAKVLEWFQRNPGGTKARCSRELGLSYMTVFRHVKDLRAMEITSNAEDKDHAVV